MTLGAVDSQIYVALNNTIVIAVADTTFTTGTGAGIDQYDNSTLPRFDDFEVLSGAWQRIDNGGRRWRDTFNRPDSTTTMGSTEGPGAVAWTPDAGYVFGIAAGKAYRVTAGAVWIPSTIPTGHVDQEISAVTTGANEYAAFALRHTSYSDYLLVYTILDGAATFGVHSSAGGTFPLVGTIAATAVSGDRITCRLVGDILTVLVNGRPGGTLNVAAAAGNPRGTRAGIVPFNYPAATVRFEDAEVIGLDPNPVANRVRGINTARVRPPDISQAAEPGELTVVLDDRNRWLDPTNTASPYHGLLGFNTQLRARVIPPDVGANMLSVDDALADEALGWPTAGWTNSTVARNLEMSRHGRACFAVTATAAADALAGTHLGAASDYVAVVGHTYYAGGAAAPATTARTVCAALRFYTAAGALVSEVFGTGVVEVAGRYVELPAVNAAAPATTAKVSAGVRITAPAAAEVHYVDEVWLVDTTFAPASTLSAFSWPGGYPLGRGYIDRIIPAWHLGDAWATLVATDLHKVLAATPTADSVADLVRFGTTGTPPKVACLLGEDRPVDASSSLVDLLAPDSLVTYGVPFNNPQKGEPLMPFAERRPFAVRATGSQFLAWASADVIPAAPWTIEIGMRAVTKDTSDPIKLTTTTRSFDLSIIPGLGLFGGRNAADVFFGAFIKTGKMQPHYVVLTYDGTTLACYCDGAYQGGTAAFTMKAHGANLLIGLKPALGADPAAYADTDVSDLVIYDYVRSAAQITEVWNAHSSPWGTDTTVGARAATALTAMSVPASLRSVVATDDAVAPARLGGDDLLTYLRRLERTEDGSRLWVTPTGVAIMRRRGMAPLVSDVYGPAAKPLAELALDMEGDAIYGAVSVTPASPADSEPIMATGPGGAGAKGTLAVEATEHPSPAAAYASAKRRLAVQSKSEPVLREVVVMPQRADVGWAAALGRDLTRRLIVAGSPPGGGSALSQVGEIVGVTHDYGQGQDAFVTTYTLRFIANA